MPFNLRVLLANSLVLALFISSPHAEPNKQPTPSSTKNAHEETKPELGTISASGGAGFGNRKTNMPWSADNDKGDSTPIVGSVSKVGRNWIAKVFNNTEFAYSVSIQILQYNNRRAQVKSDSFSTTLKAKGNVEREFTATSSASEAELKLIGVKKLGGK